MTFVEVDLLGVYVAPIAILMIAAYGVLLFIRGLAIRYGWLDFVWHLGLFEFALYVVILSAMVLTATSLHAHV